MDTPFFDTHFHFLVTVAGGVGISAGLCSPSSSSFSLPPSCSHLLELSLSSLQSLESLSDDSDPDRSSSSFNVSRAARILDCFFVVPGSCAGKMSFNFLLQAMMDVWEENVFRSINPYILYNCPVASSLL